jgi:hypothetical protein
MSIADWYVVPKDESLSTRPTGKMKGDMTEFAVYKNGVVQYKFHYRVRK